MSKIDFWQFRILENRQIIFLNNFLSDYKKHHKNSFSPGDFYVFLFVLNYFTEIEIY